MTAADALIDLIAGDAPVVRHGADEEMPEHLMRAAGFDYPDWIAREGYRGWGIVTDHPRCQRAQALRDALAAIPDHVAAEMSPDVLVTQGLRIATWILEANE